MHCNMYRWLLWIPPAYTLVNKRARLGLISCTLSEMYFIGSWGDMGMKGRCASIKASHALYRIIIATLIKMNYES